ncbi:hypothetical protein Tco_0390717 [Tanacetum coccineum]
MGGARGRAYVIGSGLLHSVGRGGGACGHGSRSVVVGCRLLLGDDVVGGSGGVGCVVGWCQPRFVAAVGGDMTAVVVVIAGMMMTSAVSGGKWIGGGRWQGRPAVGIWSESGDGAGYLREGGGVSECLYLSAQLVLYLVLIPFEYFKDQNGPHTSVCTKSNNPSPLSHDLVNGDLVILPIKQDSHASSDLKSNDSNTPSFWNWAMRFLFTCPRRECHNFDLSNSLD